MAQYALRPWFRHRDAGAADGAGAASSARGDSAAWRTALLLACALSIGVAAWVGDPAGYLQADPALARLLRGMALIKGSMVMAAIAAVFWRLGWAISKPVASSYVAGCCVLAGSTMFIWQLTLIPTAAILFHATAIAMAVVAWRER